MRRDEFLRSPLHPDQPVGSFQAWNLGPDRNILGSLACYPGTLRGVGADQWRPVGSN